VGTETVRYSYDAAWRQTSVCIDGTSTCYAGSGQYDALGQPTLRRLGNNLRQTWTYANALGRLTRLQVGTDTTLGSLFDRSYSYDGVGNIVQVSDNQAGGVAQRFLYDERDRLIGTSAIVTGGSAISIQARGNDVDGWPIMRLRVNGTMVKEWTVASATWATYSHTLANAVGEKDTVDVEFANNYSNGVGDRNLYVQSITVGSQVIPANARTVNYDRNAVDGKEVFASDGNMWWNGALRLTERYSYDAVGNLTNKAGLTYSYGANGDATGAGPYQARVIGGNAYAYDTNGNLTSGG
jgi:YD repeat-containing protein